MTARSMAKSEPPGCRRLPSHAFLTGSVLVGQAVFLIVGYVHALVHSQLRWTACHVSAVLDEPDRALMCGLASVLPGTALVCLEIGRDAPARRLRVALAVSTAMGILLTCAVSESVWFSLHASATCVTFGAGMLLAWIAAPSRAALLTAAGCVTGICQGLKLACWLHFPSILLALGEGLIILGFGLTLAGSRSAAPPPRRSAAARALGAPSFVSSRAIRSMSKCLGLMG